MPVKVKRRHPKSVKSKKRRVVEESDDDDELELPTALNEPPTRLGDSVICIYGRKGIGKTTLASMIRRHPDKQTMVFMLERGRRNLRIYQRSPKDYESLLVLGEKFANSKKYDVAVIDTIDRLHEICTAKVCEDYNVETIKGVAEKDRPSAWREVADLYSGVLGLFQDTGKGLILVSHETAREMENRKMKALKALAKDVASGDDYDEDDDDDDSAEDKADEDKVERIQPSCSPAAFRDAEQIANFVFYYAYQGRQRTITVRDPGDYVWVSSGDDEHFLSPDGDPLLSFAIPNNKDAAYQALTDAFNNKLYDINYTPPRRKKKRRRSRG